MIFWNHFFKSKSAVFNGEQEKEPIVLYKDGIEKSIPRDPRLSLLGKPRDASEQIFLSHPHTPDGFLYTQDSRQRSMQY